MPDGKFETIPVRPSTKKMVDDFGKKGETYDEIVIRMLNTIRLCEQAGAAINDGK